MKTRLLHTTLATLSMACTAQDTTPNLNRPDAQAASGGSSGSGGKGGSVNTAGSSGSSGVGGASGSAAVGGSSGSGGAQEMDASIDDASDDAAQGDGFDGRLPPVFCDGGSTYSGMSLKLDGGASYGTFARPVQDDFTLEAWIKTTSSMSGAAFWEGIPLFHADVQGGNNDFGASFLNNSFAFGMGLGPGLSDVTMQSTSTVTLGEWVHVAATRKMSTGEAQIIVNGVLENTQTYAQTASLTAATTMTIGGNLIDNRYLVGEIDEVRIWNIVRTPADILSTMYKKLAGNETGLVGYFKFDDASATTTTDSSPSHVDLQLKGNATRVASSAPLCQP
jgi:hypothetical protein